MNIAKYAVYLHIIIKEQSAQSNVNTKSLCHVSLINTSIYCINVDDMYIWFYFTDICDTVSVYWVGKSEIEHRCPGRVARWSGFDGILSSFCTYVLPTPDIVANLPKNNFV